LLLVDEHGVASTLLLERSGIGLKSTFLLSEGGSRVLVVVSTAFQVEFARKVGANGLAGGSKAESA